MSEVELHAVNLVNAIKDGELVRNQVNRKKEELILPVMIPMFSLTDSLEFQQLTTLPANVLSSQL